MVVLGSGPAWMAAAAPASSDRLALLREQGFQTAAQQTIWTWRAARLQAGAVALARRPPASAPCTGAPLPTALGIWSRAGLPGPSLRQLLDRRCEDLPGSEPQGHCACSGSTPHVQQAVAGAFAVSAGMVKGPAPSW